MRTATTTIDPIVARFAEGTLPKRAWTHTAHLTVGTWYVHRYGPEDALRRLREGILRLNDFHGTANTPTGGYHETITRAYVVLIADFLTSCRQGASPTECIEALLGSPLAEKEALLTYYSRGQLMSVEARREWVAPDVRVLSARLLCCPTRLNGGPVHLRRFRASDAGTIVPMLMDPALMKWAMEDRPLARAEAEGLLQRQFQPTSALGLGTIGLTATDAAIGFGGFRQCRYLAADDLELGWVIAPEYQRKGYATALGAALIEHALSVLRRPRILAACHPDDAVAQHVVRDKLNMQFAREVRVAPYRRRLVYIASRRPSSPPD